jgi:polysaccharide chain length determinant protein (PEP-CTERM system associated)
MIMDSKQSRQVRKYIDIILRGKVSIVAFMLLGVATGLILNVIMPKQYRAMALLSYQEQKVNPNKMSPDVQTKIREMVSTLTQLVTSRTNLEKVIKEFNLYGDDRQKLPTEDVIDMMRKKITIKPSALGDTFSISYEGESPVQVVKVTNSLAAKFIEENLKYREERATETSLYTKNELQMAKVVLDKKEAAMRDYKLKYYNEMSEQREGNFTRLNALQQQYQGKQGSIQDLERTKVMIQEQITVRKNVLAAEKASASIEGAKEIVKGSAAEPGESNAQRLERLKTLHDTLLIRYTEIHPEVIRIRKIIEKLEKVVGDQGAGNEKTGPVSGEKRNLLETDPILSQLTMQMKKLEIDIDSLNKEKLQLKSLIDKYEEWVAQAPTRETEWSSLTREYGELKKHYDFLVAQDLQAESVLHLEQKQKGSQFKIEDTARLPEKPFSPDFFKIMGMAVAIGLSLGCGLALGTALLDSSFKDVDDIETYLGLSVVCSIPYISTEKENRREKVISMGWTMVFVVSVILLGGAFFLFWRLGRIIL